MSLCVSKMPDLQQSNTSELQRAGLKCNQTSPQPVESISINDITDSLQDNHFHLFICLVTKVGRCQLVLCTLISQGKNTMRTMTPLISLTFVNY